MAKKFSEYKCTECGKKTPKLLGKCPQCGEFGTIEEVITENNSGNMVGTKSKGEMESSTPASNIRDVNAEAHKHQPTGIGELDRVLGGGLVAGGVILLAGPPGVGKALDVNTPIPTYSSEGVVWKALRDIVVGDKVFSENGEPIEVKAVTEIWENRSAYKMTFEPRISPEIERGTTCVGMILEPKDGTSGSVEVDELVILTNNSIVADENHEWLTQTIHETAPSIKTTQSIVETLDFEHIILPSKPLEGFQELIVDENMLETAVSRVSGFINAFSDIEYYGDKPIHDDLHRLSVEDKKIFVDMLIPDFDKTIKDYAYCEFTVSGMKRAKSIIQLLTELGYIVEAETYEKVVQISVYRGTQLITNAEKTVSDTLCIEVDSETHLFLAGKQMIPTHNSSILATVAGILSNKEPVLYISGEESVQQIKIRHERMDALGNHLFVINEPNLSKVLWQIEEIKPKLLIVDSLQTIASPNIDSSTGSVSQVTEVAKVISNVAKQRGIPTIFVGHYTKDGNVAGPRTVEHLVDVVLSFEGEDDSPLRLLRGIKNRFGQADEIGCFEHTENGLEEVSDPSGFFMDERSESPQGVATSIYLEGKRALPIEIQSLVVSSPLPNPRKVTTGIDSGRTMQLFAILQKHGKQRLADKDIYVSTLGNVKVREPGVDLATAFSLVSDARDTPVRHDAVFIGEIALSGKIRKVQGIHRRLAEAIKLGFPVAYVPEGTKANLPKSLHGKIILIELRDVSRIPTALDGMKASIDVGDFK